MEMKQWSVAEVAKRVSEPPRNGGCCSDGGGGGGCDADGAVEVRADAWDSISDGCRPRQQRRPQQQPLGIATVECLARDHHAHTAQMAFVGVSQEPINNVNN